jgi:hypothetical protein
LFAKLAHEATPVRLDLVVREVRVLFSELPPWRLLALVITVIAVAVMSFTVIKLYK